MSDERFSEGVNFQKVHSRFVCLIFCYRRLRLYAFRLAYLVAKKLRDNYKHCQSTENSFLINKLESVLESLVKRSDYFSSDDEGTNCKDVVNKPTMYRKQARTALLYFQMGFTT